MMKLSSCDGGRAGDTCKRQPEVCISGERCCGRTVKETDLSAGEVLATSRLQGLLHVGQPAAQKHQRWIVADETEATRGDGSGGLGFQVFRFRWRVSLYCSNHRKIAVSRKQTSILLRVGAPGVDTKYILKVYHSCSSCGDALHSTALDSRWDGVFRHVLLQLHLENGKKTPPEKRDEDKYETHWKRAEKGK